MLVQPMSWMMEKMASVNGQEPDKPSQADGLAAEVYEQMRSEFFVAGPFVLHGEVPPLLAGAWSLVRETLFTGEASRADKEVIAWSVSQSNDCPFCVDAHGAAKDATKGDNPAAERWARASSSALTAGAAQAPDEIVEHRAEYLGTLTAFQYLNRMVSVFLDEKIMPMPDLLNGVTLAMARFMMGGMVGKARLIVPGQSLPLLTGYDAALSWTPNWAQGTPQVAAALAGWSALTEAEAQARFDADLLDGLGRCIAKWEGQGAGGAGVGERAELADHSPAVTRLALLAVEAAHQVTEADVLAANAEGSSADTLALVAWAAQRAASRCADWSADGLGLD